MSVIDSVYNWMFGPTSAAGCKKVTEEAPSPTVAGQPMLELSYEDVKAIGMDCRLHNPIQTLTVSGGGVANPLGANATPEQNFWYAVARFYMETKYTPMVRYANFDPSSTDGQIVTELTKLAPNQKEAVTLRLADLLFKANQGKLHPLYDLVAGNYRETYNMLCRGEANAYDLTQRYTLNSIKLQLSISKQSLLSELKDVNDPAKKDKYVAASQAQCPAGGDTKLTKESILAAFNKDAALRWQVLTELTNPSVDACTVTMTPKSGTRTQANVPLQVGFVLHDGFINPTTPESFKIIFGSAGANNTCTPDPTITVGAVTSTPATWDFSQNPVSIMLNSTFSTNNAATGKRCMQVLFGTDPILFLSDLFSISGGGGGGGGGGGSKKNECPPGSGRYPRDENVRASLGCPPWR